MLAFDFLHRLFLTDVVLPVFVELRETGSNIVDKKLGQFFVGLNDLTEKLAMVVVHYVAKLLFEWERFQVFPSQLLGLKNKDTILQLIDFLRLSWDELLVFFQHAPKDYDVVRVEAKGEVVGDLLRHFDVKNGPDSKLDVVPFD